MIDKICPKCAIANPLAANFCRSCGYEFSEESKAGKDLSPIINEFIVVEDYYTTGSIINLMWDAENFTSITLNGENVTNRDSYEYDVKGDATIDLVASNDYSQTLKRIRILPNPRPKIIRFDCDKHKVRKNTEIKITWEYKYTDIAVIKSNLNDKEIHLSAKRVIKYEPQMGEILTIVCYSRDSSVYVEQQLDLEVLDNVYIDNFCANKNSIIESSPVTLSWNARNEESLILYPNNIDVHGKKSIVVYPTRSTEYRLEARNTISTQSEIIAVNVKPLPRLNYTLPDFTSILKISSFKLDMSQLQANIKEIDIDRWMISPLGERRQTFFSKLFHKFKF